MMKKKTLNYLIAFSIICFYLITIIVSLYFINLSFNAGYNQGYANGQIGVIHGIIVNAEEYGYIDLDDPYDLSETKSIRLYESNYSMNLCLDFMEDYFK